MTAASGDALRRAPAIAGDAADRVLRLLAIATVVYLTVTLVPMVRYAVEAHAAGPLIAHVVALGIAVVCVAGAGPRIAALRDWLTLGLGPFLYVELRWLIAGAGRVHADAIVVGWEHALFGGDPSATLALRFPNVALSEPLHACYLAFYAIVYVPPVVLYLRNRRDAFAETVLALATAFVVCFVACIVFPVDGPRYVTGPAAAPPGPVRTATLWLLANASSRGTAFPSSHVAASCVAAACAVRFLRPWGYFVAAVAAGLALATVYGGFHYAVDALAGVIVGAAAVGTARAITRTITRTIRV